MSNEVSTFPILRETFKKIKLTALKKKKPTLLNSSAVNNHANEYGFSIYNCPG